MRTFTLATLLAAAALTLSAPFGSGEALAQQSPTVAQPVKPTMPHKPSAQATPKKAPGKTCGDLMSNSQAHKDCIAKQAKTDQAGKAKGKKKAS